MWAVQGVAEKTFLGSLPEETSGIGKTLQGEECPAPKFILFFCVSPVNYLGAGRLRRQIPQGFHSRPCAARCFFSRFVSEDRHEAHTTNWGKKKPGDNLLSRPSGRQYHRRKRA